jgi:hypothetical protein
VAQYRQQQRDAIAQELLRRQLAGGGGMFG